LAIEEFALGFLSVTDDESSAAILLGVVAPFINKLSPTLRLLSITSWSHQDLSSFFNRLGAFPSLRQMALRLPFNKSFQLDTSGLTRLLHDHSEKLQRVVLRLNPSGAMIDPLSENSLVVWMTQTTSDELIMSNLQTLEIYPTLLPGGFDSLILYLRRSADTLSSLVVRDRYLLYHEVDAIVTVFSHRPPDTGLTALRLNVWTLSSRLIDLLATKLPSLTRLTLGLGDGGRGGIRIAAPPEEPVATVRGE
jgi:hypothetical protein